MEMLNIPPAQPQSNPTAAPKGKASKGENTTFSNVLGKANQNAQKDQHKGVVTSTKDEAAELDGTVQPGEEAAENSQPVVSAEGEEQTTEPSAENAAPAELAIGMAPSLPAEAVQSQPVSKASSSPTVAEDAKTAGTTPPASEVPVQEAKTEAARKDQAASAASGTPEGANHDGLIRKVSAKDAASITEKPAASADETATKASQNEAVAPAMASEKPLTAEQNVAGSPLPSGQDQRTASVDLRQKMAVPANAAPAIPRVDSVKTSEQADLISTESSKKTGLMESSLGSLLQETTPLRDQSRGRHNVNPNRSEAASLAISGEASAQVVAGTQNEDSHPSFASKQDNGFSALQSNAANDGAAPAVNNTTSFETVLNSGLQGSPTAQQGNQPLQTAPVETGSIRLASGEFLSENQIVDQVLERISVDRVGDQSRIVVKMNPEELGEVKLALTMEKDQLRAQLLTQNHQVQEVLEKHLPKLHEALNQQGVKLEDIQVGVDSNRHSGREAFADHRQPENFHRHQNAPADHINNERMHTAAASERSVSTEGLSLRI